MAYLIARKSTKNVVGEQLLGKMLLRYSQSQGVFIFFQFTVTVKFLNRGMCYVQMRSIMDAMILYNTISEKSLFVDGKLTVQCTTYCVKLQYSVQFTVFSYSTVCSLLCLVTVQCTVYCVQLQYSVQFTVFSYSTVYSFPV